MSDGNENPAHANEIVIVDDNPANLNLLESILSEGNYCVRAVSSPVFALKSIQTHLPDLILLDVQLPEIDGYEMCRRLKADPHTKNVPVIFVSILNSPEDHVKGFDVGGVDYISKPIHRQEVLARVATHVALHRMQTNLEALVAERTNEIRQSTADLSKTTDLIDALFEANPDIQFILDKRGVIVDFHSPDVNRLYAPQTISIGKKIQDLLPENVGAQFQQAFEKAESNQSLVTIEYLLPMPNGERCYEARIVSLKDRRIIVIVRDISERKQAEAEKQRMLGELQQSQKMEAVGTLAGGISHDFNNILSIILGRVQLAMSKLYSASKDQPDHLKNTAVIEEFDDKTNLQTSVISDLEEVQTAAKRACKLVGQILSFSRKTKTELQLADPVPIIQESLSLLRSSIASSIIIKQDIRADGGLIKMDQVQLDQILVNLCNNAVHAMNEKGELSVSLSTIMSSVDSAERFSKKLPTSVVRLTVADSGKGMEQTVIDQLFDPFFTTKEVGQGTGLGLSMVHRAVDNFGGTITVHSEPGVGSQFDIDFPLVEGQVKPKHQHSDEKLEGHEKILLIDDEGSIAFLVKEQLTGYGYNVVAMTDAEAALSLFEEDPNSFDLVITDQTMPVMSGLDLAEKMLPLRTDLPIILCTGYSTMVTDAEIKRIGIKVLLKKPVSINELASTVKSVLNSVKRISSDVT